MYFLSYMGVLNIVESITDMFFRYHDHRVRIYGGLHVYVDFFVFV